MTTTLLNKGILVLVVLALAGAGALAWYATERPEAGGPPAVAAETWELPAPPGMAADAKPMSQLRKRLPWGPESAATAAGDSAKAPAEVWRFVGSVRSGGQRFALLVSDKGRNLRLASGAELPSGEKVGKIEADRLELIGTEGTRTMRLYARD